MPLRLALFHCCQHHFVKRLDDGLELVLARSVVTRLGAVGDQRFEAALDRRDDAARVRRELRARRFDDARVAHPVGHLLRRARGGDPEFFGDALAFQQFGDARDLVEREMRAAQTHEVGFVGFGADERLLRLHRDRPA